MPLRVWLAGFIARCLDRRLALPMPSQNRMREYQRVQKNALKEVTIAPRDRLRRLQRVKRYLRNQTNVERDMPGHIREKMG